MSKHKWTTADKIIAEVRAEHGDVHQWLRISARHYKKNHKAAKALEPKFRAMSDATLLAWDPTGATLWEIMAVRAVIDERRWALNDKFRALKEVMPRDDEPWPVKQRGRA
jgi:hypothetical protein